MLLFQSIDNGRPLRMPWRNAIAVGRAAELLRQDLLDHLAQAQRDIGFRTCRFHAVFHDDMAVVLPRPDGTVTYQWHQLDKIYDSLLRLGLRPFVELNPMPAALASGEQTMFHYKMNVTPPRSYAAWGELVEAFARHLIDRYGQDEVRQWYFEVWNEPNLSGFWSGSQADYWKLYDASALALKRVDPALRVGGPATSKANWIAEMIRHCTDAGVPIDFISTHLYPQDEYVTYPDRRGSPHAPGAFFADTFRAVQQTVAASPRPDLEIHWTEWNSMATDATARVSWCDNPQVDNLFAASFIVRNCLSLDDACDTMCWWTASDIFEESGLPHSPFSCTYGLLTIHGIPKASYNAFTLLKRMRGAVQDCQAGGAPAGGGALATREGDVWNLLLWNHRLLEIKTPAAWKDTWRIEGLKAGRHEAIAARIRPGAGSAWETWCRMGCPHNLAPEEERLLRAHARPEYTLAFLSAEGGQAELPFELAPGEVLYIQVRPVGAPAAGKGVDPDLLRAWEADMGAQSK